MFGAALYICYYHITDPLVRSQVVAYLRGLSALGVEVHLLTFEREALAPERIAEIRDDLRSSGIQWHHLRYHQRPSLPATLYDTMMGTVAAARICQKYRVRMIHARSHVPGVIALWLKRLQGVPFIFDLRGLMAEEYADAGRWSPRDVKYRLTKRMERVLLRESDAVVMLTHRIKEDLLEADPVLRTREARIKVIPCCVDTRHYGVAKAERDNYRSARALEGRKVLIYVGKVGSWYRPDQMARFFRNFQSVEPYAYFQVLTQDDPTPLRAALTSEGVSSEDYDLRFGAPEELPLLLSSADAALSFRAGELSKRAASPTKVGECLAAGLPIVSISGIGDCDRILREHKVGLVMRSFEAEEHLRTAGALRALLDDPELRERCRRVAREEFDLSEIGVPRYADLYRRVLEGSRR